MPSDASVVAVMCRYCEKSLGHYDIEGEGSDLFTPVDVLADEMELLYWIEYEGLPVCEECAIERRLCGTPNDEGHRCAQCHHCLVGLPSRRDG